MSKKYKTTAWKSPGKKIPEIFHFRKRARIVFSRNSVILTARMAEINAGIGDERKQPAGNEGK